MFSYFLFIWWLDRNEREPFWIMFLNFFWGASGAIFLAIIGSIFFQLPLAIVVQFTALNNFTEINSFLGTIITAPIVEEFTKGIFLLMMASISREFDGVVDGVVWGGAIGLGFGMTENFLYFVTYGTSLKSWVSVVLIRTLFSAVMHCLSQATFGAFVGFAFLRSTGQKFLLIVAGYLIAVFIHFLWNVTVSFEETTILGMLFLALYLIVILGLFQLALYLEGKTIFRELSEEASLGTIPQTHLNYIPFVHRRKKRNWCPTGINQSYYIKTSIKLALVKYKFRNCRNGNLKNRFSQEIEMLRYRIKMMFYQASLQYYYNQNYHL
ncbi:MAG: PrsW family intramembrane metalloprotease [Ignavibacteria bacterium]